VKVKEPNLVLKLVSMFSPGSYFPRFCYVLRHSLWSPDTRILLFAGESICIYFCKCTWRWDQFVSTSGIWRGCKQLFWSKFIFFSFCKI